MAISYKKLWKLLIDKDMKKKDSQVCHLLITYIIKYFLILQGFPCFFLRLML